MGLQKAVADKKDKFNTPDANASVRAELDTLLEGRNLPSVLLLYGEEGFMRLYYKNAFIKAFGDDDGMNFTYYSGAMDDVTALIDTADTMPFFADKRLIVVENSELFAASSNGGAKPEAERLAEYLENLPETTCIIFSESSADKRLKLFKAVSKIGTAANLRYLSPQELVNWIGHRFRDAGVGVSRQAAELIIDRVGLDMSLLANEVDKLISYHEADKTVTSKDVLAIGTSRAEDAVFDMIEEAVNGNAKRAMEMYSDLQALKEAPIKILILIGQTCGKMLAALDGAASGRSNEEIAKALGASMGSVYYTLKTAKRCGRQRLEKAIKDVARMDELIKTGDMEDQLACELVLINLIAK